MHIVQFLNIDLLIELAFKGQLRIEKLGNQLRLLALAQFPDLESMFHFIIAGVE